MKAAARIHGLLMISVCLGACSAPDRPASRLSKSASPYLREHADNLVNWYEWGPDALAKAREENKPLIISIGYASCHWCHVMENESFMDSSVARLMNENFVAVKVDREERPDIDQVYLNAAQLTSGNAGWPLNAFAMPDGRPFYAATYFPKDRWKELLGQVAATYKDQMEDVARQADAITKGIRSAELTLAPVATVNAFRKEEYIDLFGTWRGQFDFASGGLQGAPKFPVPAVWEFLLEYHHLTGNKQALDLVVTTLTSMAMGGIYDQLRGGFARYSTDSLWRVPHFEKMLYDNGQLVSLYSHAYQVTRDPLFKDVVTETLHFVDEELTSPEGGFYSSLNADSGNEEGQFYVWTGEEIKMVLGESVAGDISAYYQVSNSGNWEGGANVLYRTESVEAFAARHQRPATEWRSRLQEARAKLLHARDTRARPSRDEKIITSWNALMLTGYVDAYLAFGRQEFLAAARKNAAFLEKNILGTKNRIARVHGSGQEGIDAFLDDYALLANAFIRLYQATFEVHFLEQARRLAGYAVAHFRDQRTGLFFYTSDDSEELVARKMEVADQVIPSSNAAMAKVLYQLGTLYAEESYIKMSEDMLQIVQREARLSPFYCSWNSLRALFAYKPFEVAIVGERAVSQAVKMQNEYLPMAVFLGGEKENLPLLGNKSVPGKTIIYVCVGKVCKLPVEDANLALKQLR